METQLRQKHKMLVTWLAAWRTTLITILGIILGNVERTAETATQQ